jgi:hypothetical protein
MSIPWKLGFILFFYLGIWGQSFPSGKIYSPKWFLPQSRIIIMTSLKLSPISVREYSTLGGTIA